MKVYLQPTDDSFCVLPAARPLSAVSHPSGMGNTSAESSILGINLCITKPFSYFLSISIYEQHTVVWYFSLSKAHVEEL